MKTPFLKLRYYPYASFVTVSALAVLLGTQGAHSAPQVEAPQPVVPRIGQFNILNADKAQYQVTKKGIRILMTGPKLALTSARYDLAAPQITAVLVGGTPQTAEATGGVHLAVRVPEQKQNSTLTCDNARYVVGKDGANAHIYATGNVRTTTRTPDLAEPLVTQSKTADVELLPTGGYNINFDELSGTGTAYEKPTQPAAPRPKKP